MGLSTHTNGNGVVANGSPLDWKHFYNTIDGKLRSTAKTRHGLLPATGEPGPEVPLSTLDDLEEANTAAKAAFETWSEVPWQERRDALLAFADALEAEKEPFSQMLTKEQGKPVCLIFFAASPAVKPVCLFVAVLTTAASSLQLKFARLELDLAVHWIRVIAKLELPEEKMVEDDNEVIVRYTPLGVTVGIVPWNYPILAYFSLLNVCPGRRTCLSQFWTGEAQSGRTCLGWETLAKVTDGRPRSAWR
jgi:acyl-CoA reductase-like NAD-dependent aldehyde dehydrogenase